MSRHHVLIVKETHRGLLYEDGVLREVLPAGRHRIPRPPSALAEFLGLAGPRVEVVLVDVRGRDQTFVVPDLLTADCVTISASFVVQYRVVDPRAAALEVRNFEDRLLLEAQTAARRTLRGLSLGEVIEGRDEIAEEIHRLVVESASAYGLEVSTLDFKDLALPDDIREALNRAACSRRTRGVEPVGIVPNREAIAAEAPAPEETELRLARMAFDPPPESIPDDGEGLLRYRS